MNKPMCFAVGINKLHMCLWRFWVTQVMVYPGILHMCTLRGQAISESAALFGPVPLQTPEPLAELAFLGSAAPPSLWPQPAASGEHTGGCSYTGGSGWTLHVEPPYTECPPVSGPPWSPVCFLRWISLGAGHPEGYQQIHWWPYGVRQSKADSALTGRMIEVLLCQCWTQRSYACCQPE